MFQQERDELSETFDKLPAPKPSAYGRPVFGPGGPPGVYGGVSRMSAAPVSMAMYQQRAGPCFAGSSRVLLADGTRVRVDSLKRGARVMTLLGPRAVAVVVRTAIPAGEALLCELGDGLVLTPWHPVMHESKWMFPAGVVTPTTMPCEAIYSFLLPPAVEADRHTVSIGGVWCTTLGHGLVDLAVDDVRAHRYLGCYDSMLRDLSQMEGFHGDGVVGCAGTRRDRDGKICGFVAAQDPAEVDLSADRATVCV